MKYIVIQLFILFFPIIIISQDLCKGYFAFEEGTTWTMTSFDKNKKKTGTMFYEVLFNEVENGETILTFTYEGKDKNDEKTFQGDFTGTCKDNTFTSTFTGLFGESMTETADVEVELTGDFIQYPNEMKPGQRLPDANIVIASKIEDGLALLKVTHEMTNRKVVGFEKVVTPAGSFDCVKITYDAKIKVLLTRTISVTEYLSIGVGVVRSETYDKKGQLSGYSELTQWNKL